MSTDVHDLGFKDITIGNSTVHVHEMKDDAGHIKDFDATNLNDPTKHKLLQVDGNNVHFDPKQRAVVNDTNHVVFAATKNMAFDFKDVIGYTGGSVSGLSGDGGVRGAGSAAAANATVPLPKAPAEKSQPAPAATPAGHESKQMQILEGFAKQGWSPFSDKGDEQANKILGTTGQPVHLTAAQKNHLYDIYQNAMLQRLKDAQKANDTNEKIQEQMDAMASQMGNFGSLGSQLTQGFNGNGLGSILGSFMPQ